MATKQVAFDASPSDTALISEIVDRAIKRKFIAGDYESRIALMMDLDACHSNGTPLDFAKLLSFDTANFGHDVLGVRRFIDRETGELGGFFSPRCAKPNGAL